MIKDILVHLDGSSDDELRVRYAESLASAVQAHLTGLLTIQLSDFSSIMPFDGGVAAAEILAELDDEARRQGDLTRQRLTERFSRLSVPNEIRRLDGTVGQLASRAASEA